MSLYTSTTKLLLKYVSIALDENQDLWNRVNMMSLDEFDLELDLDGDEDAKNLGLYSMKITLNKDATYMTNSPSLHIGYGISFIKFYVDYCFIEYFDFTTTYFNFPIDFKFQIIVKTVNKKITDGEKIWKKTVFFDLDDKDKIYEINSLKKMYLSSDFRPIELLNKLENLIENNIKYKTISINKKEFFFDIPIEKVNKYLLSLYLNYLCFLSVDDSVSVSINFNDMNFTYVDYDYFWEDIKEIFLSLDAKSFYHRFIFIYDEKIPDDLLEILKERFDFIHYINPKKNINVTYSNEDIYNGLINLKI